MSQVDARPTRVNQRLESTVTPEGTVEISLVEAGIPAPGADEVVIRVEAAPINPSDIGVMLALGDPGRAQLNGSAERPVATLPIADAALATLRERIAEPMPVGNEGAGTVVETGSGDAAQALAGRLVSVPGGGMYSQFRVVKADACLPLPDGSSPEDGAAAFINPMTVLAMVDTMKHDGHRALVNTAAASSLGQMLNRFCIAEGIPLVSVVRKPEQADTLRAAGAAHVVDSSAERFEEDLVAALRETGATLAFDAVGGGEGADLLLACMERSISDGGGYQRYGSTVRKQVHIYGGLDKGPTRLNRTYGMAWAVGGWLLTHVLERVGTEGMDAMRDRVADGLTTTFATRFTSRATLAGALEPEAIALYGKPNTGTKFLVTPNA
jgi:NADPH:quinone reductase-like Zn-dependent oxidoreductase